MADYDIDDINGAFANFRAAVLPDVRPAGFDQARSTARRRRAVRRVVLAGAVVVAVALPVATGAALAGRQHHALPGGPSATPSGRPVPTDDGPATPAAALVCPSPAARASSAAGGQGLAVTDLCDASLDFPGWAAPSPPPGVEAGPDDCHGGRATFTGGHSQRDHGIMLDLGTGVGSAPTGAVAGDVTGDGRDDVVAIVSCGSYSAGWGSEVVAFTRGPDGRIQTLGTVLPPEAVRQIIAVAMTPDGIVRVEVGDVRKSGHAPPPQRQWRSFAWNGARFAQVGGQTSFPVNPNVADLALTAADLSFGPATGGQRSGTLALTVRNLGQSSIPFRLTLAEMPRAATFVPQQDCQPSATYVVDCSLPGLDPGRIMTVTLQFQLPAGAGLGGVGPGSKAAAYVTTDLPYYDNNAWNDVATFRVATG